MNNGNLLNSGNEGVELILFLTDIWCENPSDSGDESGYKHLP